MSTRKKFGPLALAVAGLLYLAGPGCGRGSVETDHIAAVTDATFAAEVEQAAGWVVVDFWATWCGPCRALMPVLDDVAAEYVGRVRFTKIDVDENPELTARFHIGPIPHVYLFRDGEPVDGFLGYRNRRQVRDWLELNISEDGA